MENAAQKVKDWWEVADRTQRFVTIFGAAALALLLILTAFVMSRPRMTTLYSGATPEEQGQIVTELRANGIPVEVQPGGTVLVPSNKTTEADMLVAQAGLSPSTGPKGFELLTGSSSFGQTSRMEQERIIAAKEGELAKTIMTWQGVASAKVIWNVGEDSAFASESTPGSATVNIVESGGGLSPSAGKAIARLVQNATGVAPENISVMNNSGRMLYDGSMLSDTGYGAGQKLAAEISEARRRENELRGNLDAVFGPGNTIAMVQVELDMDMVQIQEDNKIPNEVAPKEQLVEENVSGGGGSVGSGPSGSASNGVGGTAPTTGPGSTSQPGSYVGKTSVTDPYYDRKLIQTTTAPGAIKGMTVQILANTKVVKDIAAVEKIANSYLGAKLNEPGFSAAVTAVDFDEKAAKDAEAAAKSVASGAKMQQIVSLLPVIALVVVGFLVIKALGKVASKNVPSLAGLPGGGQIAMAMPMQAQPQLGAIAQKPGAPSFIQYEGLQDMQTPMGDAGQRLADALGSGKIEDALRIIESTPEDPEIKAIQARINVPLEQIKHMAKTKPQAVAMLLKGWMMEDGR
jgi:flagellar M-ring protein FliF